MLINDGIFSQTELESILPSPERMKKGPVAIIECIQDIPCDPCVSSCPSHAITMKSGITDKPCLDHVHCIGCGLCVASCPGLAIFIVDMNYSNRSASLTVPHELLPIPKVGEIVAGLDRAGKAVCEAKTLKVIKSKKYDKTMVITIEVPKEHAMAVRAIKAGKGMGK